ncbi:UTP--glucose-1-phosphate uridylyltransferase [Opitutaceae bacterium EW11]|nr:UTP--glucose-1-phosphate uridylyltransferase [Opitutaceae bacterium EW11]
MATHIKKAIITAAGPSQRRLPLQSLTDRHGESKPAIAIILEEMLAAGLEKVGLVVSPADRSAYESVLAPFANALTFLVQSAPNGYGDAVLCGRQFVGSDPFLLQVSDHLYVSGAEKSCTRQLLDMAEAEDCAVSAVQATHESLLRFYGTVAGTLLSGRKGLYQIDNVIEKPTPTVAEQQCVVPGLRSGHYLCFFGMHVLTPTVFQLLSDDAVANPGAKIGLSPALARLASREKYLAAELSGRRSDLEAHFGVLRAQIALALNGSAREDMLALLAEELALDATRRSASR